LEKLILVCRRKNVLLPLLEAIMRMEAPRSQKKVQRLTGCMAALSRFISRLGEKGLPFSKLLKKVDKFQWTSEAQEEIEAIDDPKHQ
jgi:hypothetical protein